jgi:hypothetical protein
MYSSPAAALKAAMCGMEGKDRGVSCWITRTSSRIGNLPNGVRYFFVEVTCSDHTQYGIEAYDEEAAELCREAVRFKMESKPIGVMAYTV